MGQAIKRWLTGRKRGEDGNTKMGMDFTILHKWFHENHLILNSGKCHYIVVIDNDPSHKIFLNNNKIASFNKEKLIKKTYRYSFRQQIEISQIASLCKKADQKPSALARINHYLTME